MVEHGNDPVHLARLSCGLDVCTGPGHHGSAGAGAHVEAVQHYHVHVTVGEAAVHDGGKIDKYGREAHTEGTQAKYHWSRWNMCDTQSKDTGKPSSSHMEGKGKSYL